LNSKKNAYSNIKSALTDLRVYLLTCSIQGWHGTFYPLGKTRYKRQTVKLAKKPTGCLTGQNAISRQQCEIFIPKFLGLYGRDPAIILKVKKKLF